ncbi:MAG: VWA domain-containing protein [Gammaproteobacteria bacterium]|jgi:hypothetical protein|nr:VWA domain-containing protein [Gammaproteobacteria bacterium]
MASDKLPEKSSRSDIDAFLKKAASLPVSKPAGRTGRLIFAMDATASREPTWDQACHIQAEMFSETAALGGLEIQLCYYRGFKEFKASDWFTDTASLQRNMAAVRCLGGYTQIGRVLKHAAAMAKQQRTDALVFVGDCVEEKVDDLSQLAGALGIHGVPAFMFHEGSDARAGQAFRQIAKLTQGAYCRFDAGSARQLRDLLSAVAVYAVGGRLALERFGQRRGETVLRLSRQIDKG